MQRPDFILNEDISRWSDNLDNDPTIPKDCLESIIIREVCYAGLWLYEKLQELNCPHVIIAQIQYSAGRSSFGNDPWQIHQNYYNNYINNTLIFESNSNNLN